MHFPWLHSLNSNRILFVSQKVLLFFMRLPNDTSPVSSDSRALSVKVTDSAVPYAHISSNGGVPIIFVSLNVAVTRVFLTDDQREDLSTKQV